MKNCLNKTWFHYISSWWSHECHKKPQLIFKENNSTFFLEFWLTLHFLSYKIHQHSESCLMYRASEAWQMGPNTSGSGNRNSSFLVNRISQKMVWVITRLHHYALEDPCLIWRASYLRAADHFYDPNQVDLILHRKHAHKQFNLVGGSSTQAFK